MLGEGSSRKSRPSPHPVFRKVPQAPLAGFLFCSNRKLSGEQKQRSLGTALGGRGCGRRRGAGKLPLRAREREGEPVCSLGARGPHPRTSGPEYPRVVTPHQGTSRVTGKELNSAPLGPGRLLFKHFVLCCVVLCCVVLCWKGVAWCPGSSWLEADPSLRALGRQADTPGLDKPLEDRPSLQGRVSGQGSSPQPLLTAAPLSHAPSLMRAAWSRAPAARAPGRPHA